MEIEPWSEDQLYRHSSIIQSIILDKMFWFLSPSSLCPLIIIYPVSFIKLHSNIYIANHIRKLVRGRLWDFSTDFIHCLRKLKKQKQRCVNIGFQQDLSYQTHVLCHNLNEYEISHPAINNSSWHTGETFINSYCTLRKLYQRNLPPKQLNALIALPVAIMLLIHMA